MMSMTMTNMIDPNVYSHLMDVINSYAGHIYYGDDCVIPKIHHDKTNTYQDYIQIHSTCYDGDVYISKFRFHNSIVTGIIDDGVVYSQEKLECGDLIFTSNGDLLLLCLMKDNETCIYPFTSDYIIVPS